MEDSPMLTFKTNFIYDNCESDRQTNQVDGFMYLLVLLMISLLRSGIFLMSHSCDRFPFETKFHRFRVCQKCLWIDDFGDTCHGNAVSRWSLNFIFGLSKKYLPIDVFGSKFLGDWRIPTAPFNPLPPIFFSFAMTFTFSVVRSCYLYCQRGFQISSRV